MNETIQGMIDRAAHRAEIWKRVEVKKKPDPLSLRQWAILGTYAYSLQTTKTRIVLKNCLLEIGEGLKETPSTVARDYLMVAYKKSPVITHYQAEVIKNSIAPPPLYSKPGKFEYGFYVDIKATYWSILKIIGWNLDYYPGKWLSAGRPPLDFPFPDHKTARSCLVSVARPGFIQWYNPNGRNIMEKFPQRPAGSPIVNLSISKLISDILNCIALEAVELGARYANTDGYIAPSERIAANICQMILDWGLEPRIKAEGPGEVKDVGAYAVGKEISIPFDIVKTPHYLKKINAPRYKKWLQADFSKWSGKRKSLDTPGI